MRKGTLGCMERENAERRRVSKRMDGARMKYVYMVIIEALN